MGGFAMQKKYAAGCDLCGTKIKRFQYAKCDDDVSGSILLCDECASKLIDSEEFASVMIDNWVEMGLITPVEN
jgi:ribosome-binding protein aMBF1 (putative translation factor)